MKKLFVILFAVLFLLPAKARANCATISDALTLDVPCAMFSYTKLDVVLDFYINPIDPSNAYFKLRDVKSSEAATSCADIDNSLNITVTCATFQGVNYKLVLQSYINPVDTQWFYWKLVDVTFAGNSQNHKPVAESVSRNTDSSVPAIVQQLSAYDPDNDTLAYELISPPTGTGYSSAYINSNGKLYLTQSPAGTTSFSVSFRVTDGQLFSDPATVTIQIDYLSDENKETGRNDVKAEDYSRFAVSSYNSDMSGSVGEQPTMPRSIDLSANFPKPGDQGNQSSCVGWAVAYALKSYQEKVEIGWALNTPDHLFSPAFIYNQINGGWDQGSYINDALNLAINKGVSTLATMPYSDRDYRTQPSTSAFAEASKFKVKSWRRVNDTSQIKAALANRKPVVGGISVYQQFMELTGTNSLYNTSYGSDQGGHAITIVGYDDDKHGGAFKVINSWSQNWGDNGFFWIPYNFAAGGILSEAYVVEDAENTTTITPQEPTQPEPDYNTLPNLTVEDWNASYDPRPRGDGSLTYIVKNTGSGIAPAGADVNLMLSENPDITTSDYYVVYETIPFDLEPGETVYRDESIAISFNFPDEITSGAYYMALWVDDLDFLQESNENDNISVGNRTINIQNTLPDLEVETWYASWDGYGNGILTYEIVNSGASATTNTDWYLKLILDKDQIVGNGNEALLFYEQADYLLEPNDILYRRAGENPVEFNLYVAYDYYGNPYYVPSGTYYMALWVDVMDAEAESNELNNGSYSWGTVNVGGGYYYSATRSGVKESGITMPEKNGSDAESSSGKAYNGKKLPPADLIWKKVEITRMGNGRTSMKILEQNTDKRIAEKEKPIYSKTISAKAKVIFPTTSSKPMP
ncbi:MAG: hypothetical protein HQK67_07585 [Desulfamplus sp.]|nr:hypothetical protein [Desulfamplus sp.]